MVSKSKIEKVKALVNGLVFAYDIEGKKIIIRLHLRRLISGKLMIVDHHTVNGWLNYLLGEHFISPNPTSETISVESNPYVKGGLYPKRHMTMPNNDTRYYINIDVCKCFLKEHTPHTSTKQLTLNNIHELAIVPNGDNSKHSDRL